MQEDTREKDNGTEIYEETSAISEANADKTIRPMFTYPWASV